jgi:hypothetical protein
VLYRPARLLPNLWDFSGPKTRLFGVQRMGVSALRQGPRIRKYLINVLNFYLESSFVKLANFLKCRLGKLYQAANHGSAQLKGPYVTKNTIFNIDEYDLSSPDPA